MALRLVETTTPLKSPLHYLIICASALVVGCATTPEVSVTADMAVTGRDVRYLKRAEPESYQDMATLQDMLLDLPPPPPRITVIPGSPGTPAVPSTPGGIPASAYNPLLQFIQAGPGGQAITLQHLQQITPTAVALVNYIIQNPQGLSWSNLQGSVYQILSTPQGQAAYALAQSILQPLGLWTYNNLIAWWNYISPQLNYAQSLLLNLWPVISNPTPGTPGTPGIPPVPDRVIVNTINPVAVANELVDLYYSRDWLLFAERGPGLVHQLIRHVGYSKPRILLYGSRSRYYAPAVMTTIREKGRRRALTLSQEGFRVNENTSGASLFYQGPDDISLVYVPIKIKHRKVKTLDLIASDRYAWLKRAAGGDVRLLDRASTHSTGLLKANLAFGENKDFQVRVVGGSTPYASMGGGMAEVKYGNKDGIFSGRIGGGVVAENGYMSDSDNVLGYLETENTIRTPKIKVKQKQKKDAPVLKAWASTTVAAAGMATRSMNRIERSGVRSSMRWGGQGDLRLVPEFHASLDTVYTEIEFYTGITFALVPHGKVDLDVPHHSLRLYPIRHHVGGSVRLKLAKIYDAFRTEDLAKEAEKGIREWWTDEEKEAHRAKFIAPHVADWLSLTFSAVGEFSELFVKARGQLALEVLDFNVGLLTEYEDYRDEAFYDLRLGGGVAYRGVYVRGLRSIREDDYRVEAGIDFTDLLGEL